MLGEILGRDGPVERESNVRQIWGNHRAQVRQGYVRLELVKSVCAQVLGVRRTGPKATATHSANGESRQNQVRDTKVTFNVGQR